MHHETETETHTGSDTDARPVAGAAIGGAAAAAARREVSVVVDGELDIASAPHLLELSRAALEAGSPVVVLDLSAVEFLDCSGLRGLVAARALLVAAGCAVTVPAPSAAVTRLLAWTSMTEHFAPTPSAQP